MSNSDNQHLVSESEQAILPYWLLELIDKGRFKVKHALFDETHRYFVYEDGNLEGVR